MNEFIEFPKIARLSRNIVVTEKIDGTNASIYIGEDGEFLAGSRNRWLSYMEDNFGFWKWAADHKDELLGLGPGRHFGEWWGAGVGRRYGLTEKRFSLFNVSRWREIRPACCHCVPVLYEGMFDTAEILRCIDSLAHLGSQAAPGFMNPEGVIVYHVAGNLYFKKTIHKDEVPKGMQP